MSSKSVELARLKFVHYVVSVLGPDVPVTNVVKALFLADYRCAKELGRRPLFRWIKYLYGPYSLDVERSLGALEQSDAVVVRRWAGREGFEHRAYTALIRLSEKDIQDVFREDELAIRRSTIRELKDKDVKTVKEIVYSLPEVRQAREGEEIIVIPKVVKEVSIAGLRWHVVEVDPEDYEYWCDVLPPEYIVVRRGAGDEELNKIIRELEIPESVRRIVERLPNEFIEWLKKTKMTPELIDELIAEGAL